MGAIDEKPQASDAPNATEAAPLDRIWADPIDAGEPVPFDPEMYDPPMSPEEIKKFLEEQKK